MHDRDGIAFLQWALPRLQMRWPGFRKVRKQVLKRIGRRMDQLGLHSTAGYRDYLEHHADEWQELDRLCRVTISRFYRDHVLFEHLQDNVLPDLLRSFIEPDLNVWSAGCAGGEEPYTLAILWNLELASAWPDRRLRILATDSDEVQLERARQAIYRPSALRELPAAWREGAFDLADGQYTLWPDHRRDVNIAHHDIRDEPPSGLYHLVMCRNLVFTYFDEELQGEVLANLAGIVPPGGYLVVGEKESLPPVQTAFTPVVPARGLYRRSP